MKSFLGPLNPANSPSESQWIFNSPVSRPDSFRWALSQLSWKRGVSNFFLNQIPFSWSSSQEFAAQVFDYLMVLKSQFNIPIHCYEIGAGLGQLSHRLIQTMSKQVPDHAVTFHVSDGSVDVIRQLKQSARFNSNPHVSIDHLSFESPHFHDDAPPHFVILSYVFDSMPHYHLVLKDNVLFEEKIVTTRSGRPLLDTTQVPFQCIPSAEIPKWMSQASTKTLLAHMDRIQYLVRERRVRDPNISLPKQDLQLLRDYFSEYRISSCRLNYSPDVIAGFQKLCEQAPQSFIWLIQDFGNQSPTGFSSAKYMILRCQSNLFFGQNFHFISYIARRFGFSVRCTSFPKNDTQHLFIYRGVDERQLNNVITKYTKRPFGDAQSGLLKSVFRLNATKQNDRFHQKLKSLYDATLPSYHSLLMIANLYLSRKMIVQAAQLAQLIINEYGQFSLAAMLLLSQCYREENNLNAAAELLNQLRETAPLIPDIYLYKSIISLKRHDYDAFLSDTKAYIQLMPEKPVWTHILTYLIILKHHKKNMPLYKKYMRALSSFKENGYFNLKELDLTLAS